MKRILLIEDSGDLSYDIKNELQSCGYEIKQADSFLSALGMWQRYEGKFDCILLDLNINPEGLSPVESSYFFPIIGLPFMQKIGWNKDFDKKIKVIIYSGYINEFKEICLKNNISYSEMVLFEKSGTNFVKLIEYIKTNMKSK